MFKGFLLVILLIIFAHSVRADDRTFIDCNSFDFNVEADFSFEKENNLGDMRILDYRTNYYSVVQLYKLSTCFRNEVCYRGFDRYYNFMVSFPEEAFSEDRPDRMRTFATLSAKHRFNAQYLRFTMSCVTH